MSVLSLAYVTPPSPLNIVQVNPHVVLTMNKHRGSNFSLFRRLESALSADVIYRLQMLAKLRLL